MRLLAGVTLVLAAAVPPYLAYDSKRHFGDFFVSRDIPSHERTARHAAPAPAEATGSVPRRAPAVAGRGTPSVTRSDLDMRSDRLAALPQRSPAAHMPDVPAAGTTDPVAPATAPETASGATLSPPPETMSQRNPEHARAERALRGLPIPEPVKSLPDELVGDVPLDLVCQAIADASESGGLPPSFFVRLIWQESRFRQRAVSHAGAQGVAQFMPKTAEMYGLENPFDPIASVETSARFLRELLDQFGNLGLAAAAYNAGPRRIQEWLARRGKLPDETRNYVKIITGNPIESWTEQKPIELAAHLPASAPCEGVAGLSRTGEPAQMSVMLSQRISGIIAEAAEREARVKAKAAARLAKAKKKGGKQVRQANAGAGKDTRDMSSTNRKGKTGAKQAGRRNGTAGES